MHDFKEDYSPQTLQSEDQFSSYKGDLYDLDVHDEVQSTASVHEESRFSKVRKSNLYMLLKQSDVTLLSFTFIVTAISALSPAVSSILLGRVFDVLSKFGKGDYSSNGDYMYDVRLRSMSLLALGAGSMIVSWATISGWMQMGERHGLRARSEMIDTYLKMPVSWYDTNEQVKGDLTQLNRCVEELRAGNSEATALVVQTLITICALLGTSFYYSWSLTLVILATSPLIAVLSVIFAKLTEKYTARENKETGLAAKVFDWSLASAKHVRLFMTQTVEYEKFSEIVERSRNEFFKLSFVTSLNMGSMRFIMLCMFVQCFWFGSSQVRKGKIQAGSVLTCFTSCLMIGECFKGVLPQIVTIQKAQVAIKKIQGFLNLQKHESTKSKFNPQLHLKDLQNISLLPDLCKGDIKLKNVDFSYPSRSHIKVLKDVSIHFPAGKTTFLVGKSGSGKSTLSGLLLKFYKPNEGRVEIDGFSVNDLNQTWLTDNITLVEQTTTIFNDTLKNNILIGKASTGIELVTDADIQEACQMSLLHEVIINLSQGLDTEVGSRGVTLSGGQQQRVALARARLRDTPILILDESVSALDIVLRELIIEAVKKWRIGKTTIILTHELSQIGDEDYLYLMEDGKVAEHGFRKNLSSTGRFKKLVDLQQSTSENISTGRDEKTFQSEVPQRTNRIDPRFLTGVLSSLDPLSYFQKNKEDYNSEPIVSHGRNKRSSIQTNKSDVEMGETNADDSSRPDLMSINKIIKKMYQTIQSKSTLILGVIFSILNGVVNPVFSYAFSKLLSGIVPQGNDVGSSSYLLKWSLIVIFLALFDGISTFAKDFLLAHASETWIFNLRKRVFQVISTQGLEWFNSNNNTPSEINTLVLNDSRDLRSLVSHFIGVVSTVIVLASLGLIWAFVVGWKLSLVCLSLVPIFVLTTGLYSELLQRSENEYKNAVNELETQLYETVSGIKTIKVLRLDSYFKQKFEDRSRALRRIGLKRAIYTGFGVAVMGMLGFIVQGILLYYGMKLVGEGKYTIQKLMETFVLLLFSVMSCVQLMSQIADISRGQRAGTYIFNILDLDQSKTETGGVISDVNSDSKTVIDIRKLDFAYSSLPKRKVLRNFNLKITKGETVALVGESGCGKSTVSLLLTRLYGVNDGSILVKETDINDVEAGWLRKTVGLVDQKSHFFDGTIWDNLTYGLENVTLFEVQDALRLANVDEFVDSLPERLNTRIDTSLISGGQAQRLSIARALIHRPEILILDESTSALDSESTRKITDILKSDLKHLGMTVIVITHSEDMMKIADRIVTIKNGHVVEQGTFGSLMNLRGEFYRIITAGVEE